MFEIESKEQDKIKITSKQRTLVFDLEDYSIDADLDAGKIRGAGEFEIGDVSIRGIAIKDRKTIYDVEVGGVHVGIIGDAEDGLDELGISDILCTSSVRAIREVEPKMVVAMGNVDGMVTELKLVAKSEKKLKIKNRDALPATLEVVVLS